jgi:hypothetical protein
VTPPAAAARGGRGRRGLPGVARQYIDREKPNRDIMFFYLLHIYFLFFKISMLRNASKWDCGRKIRKYVLIKHG